jgi:hypothetical protein
MKLINRTTQRIVFATLLSLSLLSAVAFAGPPLICHPIEIDGAKSLPWISHDWNLSGSENYDTSKLASDTIAILDASQVTLVHMETLRRATLYARKDALAAKQLITRLIARADAPHASNKSAALDLFDSGYLAEAYKQWLSEKNNPAQGVDGYAFVQKALDGRANDPQMEFAAALIAISNPSRDPHDHAQKAIAGAKNDPLLSHNLSARFLGAQSETLSALITRTKTAKE